VTKHICTDCGADHGDAMPDAGTRCGCGNEVFKPTRETIRTLAAEIRQRWPELDVKVEASRANTDRKIPGTRLRRPGKGRAGTRIIVRDPRQRDETWMHLPVVLLDHDNAETYRRASEVRAWIEQYALTRTARGRKRS
jgi:predicted  nucleic acid-binding Zn-ribbon protein